MREVLTVTSYLITGMMIFGTYYEAAIKYYFPEVKKPIYVECSKNIVNMAKNINVTLLDMCEIENN